jgi:hypothetical protein
LADLVGLLSQLQDVASISTSTTGIRYPHAIWSGAIRDARRVLRVRASDVRDRVLVGVDRAHLNGKPQDDTIQSAASALRSMQIEAGGRETARLLKASPAKCQRSSGCGRRLTYALIQSDWRTPRRQQQLTTQRRRMHFPAG